jgi:hypothetical protein
MARSYVSVSLATLLVATVLPAQGLLVGAPAGAMPLVDLTPPANGVACAPAMPPMPRDPATEGPQRTGKQLAHAIAAVTALPWHSELDAARVESAATGRPILWLQALGELDGFA